MKLLSINIDAALGHSPLSKLPYNNMDNFMAIHRVRLHQDDSEILLTGARHLVIMECADNQDLSTTGCIPRVIKL